MHIHGSCASFIVTNNGTFPFSNFTHVITHITAAPSCIAPHAFSIAPASRRLVRVRVRLRLLPYPLFWPRRIGNPGSFFSILTVSDHSDHLSSDLLCACVVHCHSTVRKPRTTCCPVATAPPRERTQHCSRPSPCWVLRGARAPQSAIARPRSRAAGQLSRRVCPLEDSCRRRPRSRRASRPRTATCS